MGEQPKLAKSKPDKEIIYCPICGEQFSDAPSEQNSKCPNCEFDIKLLYLPQEPLVPHTKPISIPHFVYLMIGAQIILAAFLGVLFLFYADPYYFGLPQMIATLQFISIIILTIFWITLHFRKIIIVIRIGLIILGIVTLPFGVCAIAATLAISPMQRWCIVCRKKISWASYIECPHCLATMHRGGRCRSKRFGQIVASLDSEPLPSQIDDICPRCLKSMNQPTVGGDDND